MRDILRFGFILTLVAVVASGSLAWVNKITLPKRLEQARMELQKGLFSVLPGVNERGILPVEENGAVVYYEGYRDQNKTDLIGYAFLSPSRGYSSTIRTLVGVDSVGNIIAIRILSQEETPGLGTRCQEVRSGETEPWWQRQFAGLDALSVALDKDGGSIDTITGATITSRAITNGIREKTEIIGGTIGLKH